MTTATATSISATLSSNSLSTSGTAPNDGSKTATGISKPKSTQVVVASGGSPALTPTQAPTDALIQLGAASHLHGAECALWILLMMACQIAF